ncbi:hypothetical protein TrVE_jg53 [Triparma verrucosa]|uniref:Rieske domain-containing protein n=1 Tax=Triparma verrucosa TaxID=1606542 RepID=A0A9W7C1R6_9STRA|nr:hypothetical protein TrVE_jg53 [Triparma verrucosa]
MPSNPNFNRSRPFHQSLLLLLLLTVLHPTNSFLPPLNPTKLIIKPLKSTVDRYEISKGLVQDRLASISINDDFAEVEEQNVFGVITDAFTGTLFTLLHLPDTCGIKDSSKNLRVLWVRALLNSYNQINDPIAEKLLPKETVGLVTGDAKALLKPILKFAEWICSRTTYIDNQVEEFDGFREGEKNVVLFGSGYDTRALRYRSKTNLNFYEVDLPSVVEGKAKLYEMYLRENPDGIEKVTSRFLGKDLNEYKEGSLISDLESLGLDPTLPTLFIWEAVLFYVNESPKRRIFTELYTFNKSPERNENSAVVFTDSLKPFLDVPFTSETDRFFDGLQADLVSHRSRWGGAVHFATTVLRDSSNSMTALGEHLKKEDLVMSYTPTQSNNPKILHSPSLDNAWYAVGYTWQINGYTSPVEAVDAKRDDGTFPMKLDKDGILKPYATRLWNEPLVVYRDSSENLVCLTDVCPHRSAPLSMGTVEDGSLKCFYHGWSFGDKGECDDVPTQRSVSVEKPEAQKKFREKVTECQRRHAVVEKDGLVYVWRGELLEADPRLLPSKRTGDMETQPIDSVLDYAVDYSYIVENNLDSPHLFYLHDGSVPPIESIGMMSKNLPELRLRPFQDDCGFGHLGRFGDTGRVKKLLRFDPPNIVRHGGVSGFEEEFHIVPVAPGRSRVLLRQHLPKGPILSTITSIPKMLPFLTALVNQWNNHIALEDGAVMQGQSHLIEDMDAPRMQMGGLGDDLMARYWEWRRKAYGETNPWFGTLQSAPKQKPSIPTGTTYGDSASIIESARELNNLIVEVKESVGIKQKYVQQTPEPIFAPMNSRNYLRALVLDDFVKSLFQGLEPSSTMLKTERSPYGEETAPREKALDGSRLPGAENVGKTAPTVAGLLAAAATWGVIENAERFGLTQVLDRVAVAVSTSFGN